MRRISINCRAICNA